MTFEVRYRDRGREETITIRGAMAPLAARVAYRLLWLLGTHPTMHRCPK